MPENKRERLPSHSATLYGMLEVSSDAASICCHQFPSRLKYASIDIPTVYNTDLYPSMSLGKPQGLLLTLLDTQNPIVLPLSPTRDARWLRAWSHIPSSASLMPMLFLDSSTGYFDPIDRLIAASTNPPRIINAIPLPTRATPPVTSPRLLPILLVQTIIMLLDFGVEIALVPAGLKLVLPFGTPATVHLDGLVPEAAELALPVADFGNPTRSAVIVL